jgi:cysteine desulfurase/selenocysteine lyase
MSTLASSPSTKSSLRASAGGYDVLRIREDFPILKTTVSGKPLIYLDNGATTQKPRQVIDAIKHFYETEYANIHRGVYYLSQLATDRYEGARHKVRKFINAAEDREIIFTRGTTESINLVASSFGRLQLREGDEIIVSNLEHHANIVPWQMICQQQGAMLRVIPINERGELLLDEFEKLLKPGTTKIVAVNHISNALGTINDLETIIRLTRAASAVVLIDGAQWVAHHSTDVRAIDADFYCFSSHKLYGPTGIGVLYGKRELLEAMPPYQTGGDMILSVKFEGTTFADLPNKFEAGTPDIAGAVGLGAAIDYVCDTGLEAIAAHEELLANRLTEEVGAVGGVRIIGTAARKAGICSFVVENPPLAAHDLGIMLDMEGIAVRTGHHCCQPLMERMKVSATVRASVAMYNTEEEIVALAAALHKITASAPRPIPIPATSVGEVEYPKAVGAKPQAVADELAQTFEFLGERDQRNQYILELGEKLPAMPLHLKLESNRVHGCMSTVHLVGRANPKDPKNFEFIADSDAHIVRGLIAILEKLYSGQRARDVLDFDIESFFRRINLDQFISSQRRNGLAGMIKRIRAVAGQIESGK